MTFYTNKEVMRIMADCITYHQPLTDLEIVIRTGVNLNIPVHKGLRPMHYAAYENSPEVIQLLVDHGAMVNITDDVGYTPLHISAKRGHRPAMERLIACGAVVNFFGDTLTGSDAQDTFLRDAKALSELTVSPLNLAIENDHPACVRLLLQHGADANQKYFLGYEINLVPLDHVRCLEVLLQNGADPNVHSRGGVALLHKAAKHGATAVVRTLAAYGADLDIVCDAKIEQKRALHYAVLGNNLDTMQVLLEAGASTMKPPEFGYGPLELAVTQDKVAACRMLLAFGADSNELNADFCTPLQVACSTPDLLHQREIIGILLDHGADPNYARETYSHFFPSLTPVVEYLSHNHVYDNEIFRILLKHGAEMNMTKPTRKFSTIVDKYGILAQVRKLRKELPLLELFMEVCGSFDKDEIEFDRTGLSDEQRSLLLHEAQVPRSLAHLTRLAIRRHLKPPKLVKIQGLPLPPFFKRFLTFDFDKETSSQTSGHNGYPEVP